MPISLGMGMGIGMGGGLQNPLARLLAIPNLVAAFDAADTASMNQAGGLAGAIGAPVYFMLDQAGLGGKTVGQYLATAPEKAVNGSFTNGTTGWSAVNATLSVVAGRVRIANPGAANGRGEQVITTVVGRAYVFQCDFYGGTSTAATLRAGTTTAGAQLGTLAIGSAGVGRALYFVATTTTTYIGLQGDAVSGSYVELANVSFKELPSVLATAAAYPGRRPTLHSGPYLDYDGVDDLLNANFITAPGASCSVLTGNADGSTTWQDGVTIGTGNYGLPATDNGRVAIFSNQPSVSNKLVAEAWVKAWPTPPFEDGFLALSADFESGVFEAAGAPETIAAWTDNGDGTYSRTVFPDFYRSRSFTNAATVTIEYKMSDLTVTGVPFHWMSVNPNEFFFSVNTADPAARLMYAIYSGSSFLTPNFRHPNDNTNPAGLGRRRVTLAIMEGVKPHGVADNFIARTEPVQPAMPAVGSPTKLTVGKNGRLNTNSFTDEVCKVWIHAGMMSDAQIEALARVGEMCRGVHMLGDSFGNNNRVLEQLMLRTMNRGFMACSSDPIGGSTVENQSARFLTDAAKFKQSTLVWLDGGLGDTAATAIASIDAAVAALPHGQWVYTEPGPVRTDTAPQRADWDARVAAIKAHCGAHWIDTLAPLTNTNAGLGVVFHDGSANDLADIAAGLWPRSLCLSDVDFHPNNVENSAGWSGVKAIAYLTDTKLIALGYVPA